MFGFRSSAKHPTLVAPYGRRKGEPNAAQRLIDSFYDPVRKRRKFEPKRSHTIKLIGETGIVHTDRATGRQCHKKPVLLKREVRIDKAKKYPYSSKRQTAGGRIDHRACGWPLCDRFSAKALSLTCPRPIQGAACQGMVAA
jgi:hypothetical protein